MNQLIQAKEYSYLALGDSYTVGQGVNSKESFPFQLVKKFETIGIHFRQPRVIAKTGWRSDNLIQAIGEEIITDKYDLITLLIGVNNQFQQKSITVFMRDLRNLLNTSLNLGNRGKKSVYVLSIPDYGCTPFGLVERENIAQEITQWNDSIQTICKEFEVPLIDITTDSKKALNNDSMTCKDKLHPSGKMYALWAATIFEEIKSEFSKETK